MAENKRKLVKKTPEQVTVLEELYEAGMKSYKSDNTLARSLLEQAVLKTGLSESKIKVCSVETLFGTFKKQNYGNTIIMITKLTLFFFLV